METIGKVYKEFVTFFSFRLSFKRKDRGGSSGGSGYGCREHRDSISAVPARFIQATSVRRETLNPKWGENFML